MPSDKLSAFIEKYENLIYVMMKNFNGKVGPGFGNIEITIPQMVTLDLISKKECPKMSDLSAQLGVTLGNMTMMVDRLVKEKFILRKDDPLDRRIVRVCLSQKGKGLIRKVSEHKRNSLARIFEKISETDRKYLLNIIEKLTNAIKEEQERG